MTTLREHIHAVMRDELSIEPPPPDADLIASGLLDSLAVVTLLVELEQRVGIKIPLGELTLEDLRTVERLESLLGRPPGAGAEPVPATVGGSPRDPCSLLMLLRHGRGRPFYLVHDADGDAIELRPIADSLRTQRPVWGLRALGRDPTSEPQRTIEEMAATYIEEIRRLQPGGPYAIAGKAFGALVAFEMAVRLRAAGEGVDVLALIDAGAATWPVLDSGGAARRLPSELEELAQVAAAAYHPSVYFGAVTVFRGSSITPSAARRACVRRVAGRLRIVTLPDTTGAALSVLGTSIGAELDRTVAGDTLPNAA
jgi:thioesterase domain-containing protein/acyl carrier protein